MLSSKTVIKHLIIRSPNVQPWGERLKNLYMMGSISARIQLETDVVIK